MRTEYRLFRWTEVPHSPAIPSPVLHPTVAAAMSDSGYPDPADWQEVAFQHSLRKEARQSSDAGPARLAIRPVEVPETDEDRITLAVDVALEHGQNENAPQLTWTIDQMLRLLLGDGYDDTIARHVYSPDPGDDYVWETGVAP